MSASRLRRRAWIPWLASALLHVGIVLVIRQGRWAWSPPRMIAAEPLELTIVSDGAPVPGPGPGLPSGVPPEQLRAPPSHAFRRTSASRSPPALERPVPEADDTAPVVVPAPTTPSAPAPAWMHTRGLAASEAPAGSGARATDEIASGEAAPDRHLLAPELSWDGLSAGTRDRLAGPAPPPAARAKSPHLDANRLRVARERAEDAVANVRTGRVDPFLHDLVRDARLRFESGARRIAAELPLDAQRTAASWVHGYAARVDEVNKRTAAARAGTSEEPEARGADPPRPLRERSVDLFEAYGEATRVATAGAAERRVQVCLNVAPGRQTTAAVKAGSGDAALDQLAPDAFVQSAAARPIPADAHASVACYDLRVRAYRIPPLPVLSCGIDKNGPTCAWPFKKITSVTVHLDSVEYEGEGDNGSLLRRPH